MQRLRILAALALAAATACSSHGGAAVTPPTTAGGSSPVTTSGTHAQLTVVVPQAGTTTTSSSVRRPSYVSPSSANLVVAVNGGTPSTYGLTQQSPGCAVQNGKQTCSFSVAAPAGVDTLALSVTDGAGAVLSRNVVTATIAAGVATPVAVTLAGVPASVAIVPGAGATIDGTSAPYHVPGLFPQPVEVEPLDADGNIIIGPGAPTINTPTVSTGTAYATIASANTTDPAAFFLKPVDGSAGGQTVTISATVNPLADGTPPRTVTGTTTYTFTPAVLAASGAFVTVYSVETQNPIKQFNACPGACALTIVDDATTDAKGTIYLLYHQSLGLSSASTLSVYPPGTTTPSYSIGSAAGLHGSTGVAVDKNGAIYVANALSGIGLNRKPASLQKFAAGAVTATTTITASPSQPGGIQVDAQGNIYLADQTGVIDVYAPGGKTPAQTLSDSSLAQPTKLALDASGGLYVKDATNAANVAYFAAGQTALTSTLTDGSFGVTPAAPLMIDPSGNLWVSLTGNRVIERLSASALPNTVSFLPQFNAGGVMGWIP